MPCGSVCLALRVVDGGDLVVLLAYYQSVRVGAQIAGAGSVPVGRSSVLGGLALLVNIITSFNYP